MDKDIAKELLKRYSQGNCSVEEQVVVSRWYLSESSKRKAIDPTNPIKEHDLIWKGVQTQLSLKAIPADASKISQPKKTSRTLFLKWFAAASLAIVVSLIFYRLTISNNHENLMTEIRKNDIAPGGNSATLTLPNGSRINLSGSKTGVVIDASALAYNDGTSITSSLQDTKASPKDSQDEIDPNHTRDEMAQIMKLTPDTSVKPLRMFSRKMINVRTPRGGTYQVVLPDGSKVWLNAASSLIFPQEFADEARIVMLTGEAYFEIAKNPKKPFRVLTIGQHINVLGTHFNVNAYRDESAPRTTLVEGSVNVFWANQTAILKPGQQAVMENKNFKIAKVNTVDILAWKNGKFRFVDEDIKSIMRKISRWYDVDVEYRGEITKEKFGGQVSKFSNVSDILEVLQLTGFVHFKIERTNKKGAERRIVVLP